MGRKLVLNKLRWKKILTASGVRFWKQGLRRRKGAVGDSEWSVAAI